MAPLGRCEDERLDCQMITERLADAVRTKRAELGAGYDLSVSVGSVVASAEELDDVDDLLARTDRRMYDREARAQAREGPP